VPELNSGELSHGTTNLHLKMFAQDIGSHKKSRNWAGNKKQKQFNVILRTGELALIQVEQAI
jgi:hypothetical protein